MEDRDLIYISNVADKYNNYLYPELRYHVENYLTNNYDKVIYYAKYKFNINVLIEAIVKDKEILRGTKEITTRTIMDIVAPLVEREVFIREV